MKHFNWRMLLIPSLVVALGVTLGAVILPPSFADEPAGNAADADEEKVSFYKQIRPIFQARCHGCHQPAKASGLFVMTAFDQLVSGGESELPAIVPGQVDESYLVEMITPHEGKAEMPKDEPPLDAPQLALIQRWIAEGALDDTPDLAKRRFDVDHPPQYNLPPVITALDVSPDGQLLAVSGYHEVLLHHADGSGLVARLIGMSERIESIRFSPDGTRLAVTGGLPARMGEVQIWDVAQRELALSIPVTYDSVYGASWSHDGSLVAFGCSDNTVRAIDAATGQQVLYQGAHSDWVLDTVFSVESTHLVSVSRDRSMKLIEVKTERFVDNITSITPGALQGGLAAVDRHPAKDEILIGGADGVPKLYRMYREKARKIGDDYNLIRKFDALPGRIFAARFNRDGSRIVAGSSKNGQGEVRVYQTDDGKQVCRLEGTPGPVYTAVFAGDGAQVIAGGFDGVVRAFDANTGEVLREQIPVPLANSDTESNP